MSTYDLIGFDMDGTILNSEKTISGRTLDAVNRAASSGKKVILSTGRCISELKEFEDLLQNVRYYVCESGALIYDTALKSVLHSETFPRDTVERVLEIAAAEDVMVYMMSAGAPFANRREVSNTSHFHMGLYQDMMNRTANQKDDLAAYYRSTQTPVEKLNLFSASAEIRERIYARIRELPVSIAYSEETSLELSPLHVSKASGLVWLCRYLRIPLERTVVVGDADNDAEVLRIAGLSVAMGNALPRIKKICDVVVADNDHDGCAEAVDRYLLSANS
ncbi:hydrolase [Clostridium sp. W14A]|nr:hydrolase [Clostridium sp. W14A]